MRSLILFIAVLLSLNPVFAPDHALAQAPNSEQAQDEPIIIDGREAEELWIVTQQGRFRFTAEIADDDAERASGLMFREKMQTTHGMLFDFGEKRRVQMWMRNTPLSLDMIFTNAKGKVMRIVERTTPFSDAIIDSIVPVTHVLEVKAGVARLIGLRVGDTLEHRLFEKD